MNNNDNIFKEIISALKDLDDLNEKVINMQDPIRSSGGEIELPLSKRLRDSDEEAVNREAMEDFVNGGKLDKKNIDGIVEEYIQEKILRNF